MNYADKEVIAMVNRPHVERAWKRAAHKENCRRQAQLQRTLLLLIIRIEYHLLGVCLFCIGAMHEWVAGWLAAAGVLSCIAMAAVTFGRFIEVRRYG